MKLKFLIIFLLISSLLQTPVFGLLEFLPKYLLYFFTFCPVFLFFVLIINTKKYSYTPIFIICIFIITLSSLVHFRGDNSIGDILTNINIFIQLLNGYLLVKFSKKIVIDLFEIYIPIIGLIGFPIFLMDYINTSYEDILRRGTTWTGSFFFTAIYALAPHSLLISISKKKTIIQIIFLIFSIILFLFFLKRIIFLDIILLFLIFTLFKKIKTKTFIYSSLFIILGYVMFVEDFNNFIFINDFIDKRFSNESLENNGRDSEVLMFLKNTNIIDFIFGSGIDANNFFLEKKSQSLHSGWFNFIFKYGFIFMLYLLLSAIYKITRRKTPTWIKSILIFFCIKFFVHNSYYISPEITLFTFALFYKNEN